MSVVPAALDALVSRLQTRLPDVQIYDGPEAEWPELDFIAVGLSPEDLETPSRREPRGPVATMETAEITCLVSSAAGDTDIRARRVRAYELLDEVQALLDEDNTLGGACGLAEVTGSVYDPAQTPDGALVHLIFTVQVTAF